MDTIARDGRALDGADLEAGFLEVQSLMNGQVGAGAAPMLLGVTAWCCDRAHGAEGVVAVE